ncbi:MAG: hypothetical protein SCJ93_12150 [Bacillota bacterium]|nr:hypothetical protein [Bacillota bacterium]
MKLVFVENNNEIKQFINFYKTQYIISDKKINSLSPLLKRLLNGDSKLCKSVDLEALMIIDNQEIIMIALLAYAHRMKDILQISFFESSTYKPKGFKLILDRAKSLAKEKGISKLSASLNIHVNYGLGFLASDYDKDQSFGMSHNPEFYHKYFEENGFNTVDLISYKKNMNGMERLLSDNLKKRLNKKYSVRKIDFKNFEKEIQLYTEINNQAFANHLFYYPRNLDEDMELFKDLKFLLKEENLLFVEKGKVPIGFMLWYPDYNQLMKSGESIGISTVIKNKLLSKKITTFKIVEIGVIQSEQNKGAILALFEYCFQCIKGRFKNFESSWILKGNEKSKAFGIKWSDGESKKYKAYIKEL